MLTLWEQEEWNINSGFNLVLIKVKYNISIVWGSIFCQLKTELDTANEWEIINWKKLFLILIKCYKIHGLNFLYFTDISSVCKERSMPNSSFYSLHRHIQQFTWITGKLKPVWWYQSYLYTLLPSSMSLLLTRKISPLILGYDQLDFGCMNKVNRNICRIFINETCLET